ncbi:DUF5011 domain-containing protein [Nitrosopumilus sp. K4]|uniref:DUF5011 domain-containing protein n=1 Tax=Nitrosopumilus sp. K4 TaxID=2795383 RepID=UPI001BABCEF5|nr:DUF5011 domain-containing protein [Nitrosopumilus sp. K4]QUC65466.1 DUF5011 domain-containing protein [Nitrosopumilus sp. K4]
MNKVLLSSLVLIGIFSMIPAFATSAPAQIPFNSSQFTSSPFESFAGGNFVVFDTNSQNEIILAERDGFGTVFGKFSLTTNGYDQYSMIKNVPAQTITALNIDSNDSIFYATTDKDAIKKLSENGSDTIIYDHDARIADFVINPQNENEIYLLQSFTNEVFRINNGIADPPVQFVLPGGVAATIIAVDSSGLVYLGYGVGSVNGIKVLNSDLTQSSIPDLDLETATGASFFKVGDIDFDSNDNVIVIDENWFFNSSRYPSNIHRFHVDENGVWQLDWTTYGTLSPSDSTSPPTHNVAVSCNGEIIISLDIDGSGVFDSLMRFDAHESTSCGNSDTEPPVITLTGDDPLIVEVGTSYAEQGANAIDNRDGDISSLIVINSSEVNTYSLGTYAVTYDVTDSSGNVAEQVTRTVNVVHKFNVLSPLENNSSNIANQGSTIPIQFELIDEMGNPSTPINSEEITFTINSIGCPAYPRTIIDGISEESDETFKATEGKYKLNFDTKPYAIGCYSFDVIVQGLSHFILVELK